MTQVTHLTLPRELNGEHEAIAEKLLAMAAALGAGLYATLDLAVLEDPKPWLQRLKRQGNSRNLFASQPEASAETLAAWLLPVTGSNGSRESTRLLRETIALALQVDGVTWLMSNLGANDLAERLSLRLTAALSEGSALFRYYDPRLLPVIHASCDESQRTSFFALGQAWWYLDAHRCLQQLPLSAAIHPDPFAPPVTVSAIQQQLLQAISERHQLLRFLLKRRPLQLAAWDYGRQLAFVEEQGERAEREGLTDFTDRLNYCLLAMDSIEEARVPQGES